MRSWIVVGLILSSAATAAAGDRKWFDPAAVYDVQLGDASPTEGPADAPVTIVEWSDYACRYCNRVQRTLHDVARLDSGKVRWVYRHLPLDSDDTLTAEAGLAAAAQGQFWPMHDRLFAVHGHVDRAGVEEIAQDLGLDMTRFRGDLDAGTYRQQVLADAAEAFRLGVSGTPTFFVNGRALRGAQPLGVFLRVIDEEAARAKELLDTGVAPADLYAKLVEKGADSADADEEEDYETPELDPAGTYKVGLGLDGHALGKSDALVTVVEWSDFQCPYCGQEAPVLEKLRDEYGDDVRIIYRHFPLPMHPDAELAAEAAVEAAVQGKFWAFHDRLFADQDHLSRADLDKVAKDLGLDMKQFDAALDDRRHQDAVADDAAAGAALGITGTPSLFINGSPIEGAASYDQLKYVVEARLDEARSLIAHGIAREDVYGTVMGAADGNEHGDPSRVPKTAMGAKLELRQDDREEAVEAACRGRDADRAGEYAGRLEGDHKAAAKDTCAAYGIDLK
jgi:protein-disulfide isomerase